MSISQKQKKKKKKERKRKEKKGLDICVQNTGMPPPTALSKMVPWLRYWLISDNYRSTKADLYNIKETNEGPCR